MNKKFMLMTEAEGGEGLGAGGAGGDSASEGTDLDVMSLMQDDSVIEFDDAHIEQEPPAVSAPAEPTPVVQPAATSTPVVEQASQPTAAPAAPAAEPQADVQAARQQAYTGLVESWKKVLPDDSISLVMADPHTYLPQLMAQVELRAMETAIQQVQSQFMGWQQQYASLQQSAASLEQTFFAEYPQLAAHTNAVVNAVKMAQQMPGYDFSDASTRKRIAGMVMMELGIMPGMAAPQQPPARPTPAPAGSFAGKAPAQQPANPWLNLLGDD